MIKHTPHRMKPQTRSFLIVSAIIMAGAFSTLAAETPRPPARHPSYEPPVYGLAAVSPQATNGSVKGLQGGVGIVDTRYAPTGALALSPASGGVRLSAWRGERASAQIVVSSDVPQNGLRVESAGLRNGTTVIPVQANFVRYTFANLLRASDQVKPGDEKAGVSTIQPQGDILDTESQLDLSAGANRPIWLTVDVPANAGAGNYHGSITVRSDAGALNFPVTLEVLPATLPTPREWLFYLDLWQQPEAVARYHRVALWSPEHFALLKPLMKRLADAGQKTITCSLFYEPWGGQIYDRIPGMIGWLKKADGSWSFDYSIFDQWVTFMSGEVGLSSARINCYSMIPWALKFRYYDEAKQASVDVELTPGTPEYDEYWGRFLKDFTQHLSAKGWLERTRISMDERPDKLMHGALATLAKHAPGLKVATAVNQPSQISQELDDVSQILDKGFESSAAGLSSRRQLGRISTFYVCTAPRRPNTFTFSPPAEAEWLGIFASANGFDGVLRWAYCSWVEDPLVSTDFTSWESGDCFLVYPGNRSSIRFERLRDGIEDFEKIRLLREWAAAAPTAEKQAALAKLDVVLKDFSWPRGAEAGVHTEDVRRAVDAIATATRIIAPVASSPNSSATELKSK